MKKALYALLSVILCVSIALASSAVFLTPDAQAADIKAELTEKLEPVFDKFVNIMIDVIHRGLVLIRYPWKPKTDRTVDMSKFTLVFADEFDGEEIDLTKWTHYRQGVRKGGYWDKDQAFLRDGNLVIRSEYKADGKYGEGFYTDRIDTRRTYLQTYGYCECRCSLPAAEGLWSAFRLSSENIKDGTPGTQGTEIDVFESPMYYRGRLGLNNNLVSSNLHYGGYELGHRYKNVTITRVENPYAQYNTYGVEWNADGYIFYVNGRETGRSSFGGVSEVPEYMLLSTEFDGVDGKPFHGWSGIAKPDAEDLPAEFIVDYVRAYQYTD